MPPDFLNSREDAILVWGCVLVAFALSKDFRGIGGSFVAVLRTVFCSKLVVLFGTAAAYSGTVVYIASTLGVWHSAALKETVYWYVGTAVVLAGEAVTTGARDRREMVRRALGRVVAVTVLIEFIVDVYAMPLAFELVGALLLLLFTGVEVVARRDETTPPAVLKFIDGVLITLGLIYLVYFAARVLDDVDGFLTRENADDFLVPTALTVALMPFLYLAAWWSRREQDNLRKRFKTRLNAPA